MVFHLQAQRDIIFELRRIAFDGESDPTGTEKRKAMYTKDYKMLGFTVSNWFLFNSLIKVPPKNLNVFFFFLSASNAEPCEPSRGFYPDSPRDAGSG